MLLTQPAHPEIGLSRFTTIVELLQVFQDALTEHLDEYIYGLGKLESANLQSGSDLCFLDCVEDFRPRKQIMCNIPPMFMSGEELDGEACDFFVRERNEPTNGVSVLDLSDLLHIKKRSKARDASSKRTAPLCPDLTRDLESFFWVLLWLCIYRGGPARARTLKLHDPDFESEEDLIATVKWATRVFEGPDLGAWKAYVFINIKKEWNQLEACIHPYFYVLSPLLEAFHRCVRWLMWLKNRTNDEAVSTCKKLIDFIGCMLQTREVQTWDEEGNPGGEAVHVESRKAELERRRNVSRAVL